MRASLLGKRGSQTGSRRPAPPIAALVLILAAVSGLGCGGSPTPPSPPPPSPSTLVGEWVLVTSDRPGAPSGIGVRRKVFTQTTWSITQRDPATGDVVFHHGGTYTLSRKVMFPNSLIHLLDVRFPGQTWVTGVLDPERIEAEIKSRLRANTPPAGTPVRNTWLGRLDVHRIGFTLSVGDVEDNVDALLLLTSSSLHGQPRAPLDPTYERELMRRRAIADATLPFRGAKIRFEERVAKFEADADAPVQIVLKDLLRDRGLRILVKAFADGTEVDADTLSLQRATLVVNWLTARGVERERLMPRGCGARRPLTLGNTALERAMNRRAELVRLTPTAGCEPPW